MAERPSPPLDAGSRAWSLAASAVCLVPLLLQLPGRAGIGIGTLALLVAAVSWRFRVPGWLRLLLALALIGLVLSTSRFAFGRDTGCAMLAAMLALKPVELFTLRDGRSLLGFALFAPFATFLLDQGPLSLLLGLGGAALVLAALLRLAELESASPAATAPGPWRRLATVARLMAVGLPLALAAFWLFPRIGTPLWGVPERAVARPGLSDTMTPGEWIDLLGDDSPALRVQFLGAAPPREQMYWRGPVLVHYDGRSWTRADWLDGLPPAEATHGTPVWEYEVEAEPTDRRHVVALELPLAAPEGVRMAHDYSMSAERPLSSLRRWRMRSAPPRTLEPELAPMHRGLALRLPEGFNPRAVALARQWRQEAGADDAAIVRRMLEWIRGEFVYTLATPLAGRHAVDEFLFEQQQGYCEHYSSAFVVMMRAAGIPARVVTGYVGGYYNRFGDYWVVRRMDAHAWAEVWLAGRGWVRVDPTAAVAPERIYDTVDDLPQGGFDSLVRMRPVTDFGDWMRRGWNDFVLGFDAARQQRLLQPLGIDRLSPSQLIVLFSALGGAALAWMLWLVARGERERDPVLRAWRRLGTRYARLGLGREPHEPAGRWVSRVLAARPGATRLAALSARFERWRYAAGGGDAGSARALARELLAHRPDRMQAPEKSR
ncbi:DUF3488 and transglutaminase-like domain-containing protein [Luteimonas sp. RD2P54]|uniref:DUF3488 and transglutaminase-like domain-containing protein n=1 Tax=Luteimonas endophytica TaxID=3042023 RepID=A0ABT6J3K2_9GAMM|nr:DUF3488 and transglutaminase-like domain-containing protein [Luteimonas endophytica]MDH5821403.1 DUF3488 and transglutaminase-like domain-containing protein [Luteimonas endophytica]